MKTLKKALSIILGLAIMLSCVAGMQVSVAAEGTVALSVGEATVADGVVTVPVVVDANAGFQSLAVTVSYDNAVLSLVEGKKNTAFTTAEDCAVVGPTDANPFKMMWAYALSTENVTATGTIATLTFNLVDETAKTADITLAVTEAWDVAGNEVAATTAEKETVDLVTGPAVDSKLVVAGAAVGFADSSLQVNFRIRKTVVQLYDKVELVIAPQKYDRTTYNLSTEVTEIVPELTLNGAFYTYAYTDIQLYELGLNIDYMLKAYDAEGNLVAVSNDFSVVPANYLKTLYTTADALNKTLITDTLIVGAEAAIMFANGKPDCDLAKATSVIEGFDTSAATQTVGDYNTVDSFNSYDSKYGNKSSNTYYAAKSAAIGKAASLTYRLRDRQALDVSKFEFKVAYDSVKLSGKTEAYSKTFTSADGSVVRNGQFVTLAFDQVSFCDSDKDIALEVYYDGVKVYDMTYSIESYLGANMADGNIGGTVTALIKLGISARAVAASKAQ